MTKSSEIFRAKGRKGYQRRKGQIFCPLSPLGRLCPLGRLFPFFTQTTYKQQFTVFSQKMG